MSYEKVIIGDATRIYALCDPTNDEIRYVGKTVQSLRSRLLQHRRAGRRGNLPVNRWMNKHEGENLTGPFIRMLELVPSGQDWEARETHWISELSANGANLLNLTRGGEGLPGHSFSEDHRAKIAAALRTGAHCKCIRCGEVFWRKANQISRGHNKFCSRTCANKHNKGGW